MVSAILAGFLVFFSSAAVLALEILAARLLAPFVGVTLETYSGVIATVLAGISLGAWIGGRLADRWHPRYLIGPAIALGGVLTLTTGPIVRTAGPALSGSRVTVTVVLALLAFFGPALVLSTVPPLTIKLQLRDLSRTGRVAGRLSATSTAGAIVGTLLTGYVFIAAWPIRMTLLVLGASLVAIGLAVWIWLGRARVAAAAALLVSVVGVAWATTTPSFCDSETKYYCARIEEEGETERVLFLDNLLHSFVDLEDPLDLRFYVQTFADVVGAVSGDERAITALHLGGGGFSFPRYVAASRPGSRNHVLEVDPGVVALARDQLGLRTGERLTVAVGDARLGIRAAHARAYDVVVGDAFGGLAVPWHLTTAEFVQDVRRTIAPQGLYLVNLIDFPPSAFVRAQIATMRDVFKFVVLIASPSQFAGMTGGNFVAVGSDAPLDAGAIEERIRRRGSDERVYSSAAVDRFVGDARVLRDDYAPVDQLLTAP